MPLEQMNVVASINDEVKNLEGMMDVYKNKISNCTKDNKRDS